MNILSLISFAPRPARFIRKPCLCPDPSTRPLPQSFAGKTKSEGGFADNSVVKANLIKSGTKADKKGKTYYTVRGRGRPLRALYLDPYLLIE